MTKEEESAILDELSDKGSELTKDLIKSFKRMGLKKKESVVVLAASTSVILTMAGMEIDMYAEMLKSMLYNVEYKIEYPTAAHA